MSSILTFYSQEMNSCLIPKKSFSQLLALHFVLEVFKFKIYYFNLVIIVLLISNMLNCDGITIQRGKSRRNCLLLKQNSVRFLNI